MAKVRRGLDQLIIVVDLVDIAVSFARHVGRTCHERGDASPRRLSYVDIGRLLIVSLTTASDRSLERDVAAVKSIQQLLHQRPVIF